MDKVIVTVLLIIGGIVAAFAIVNGTIPAMQRSSSAISAASEQVNDQIKSQIEIINISSNESAIQVWVKNVGNSVINNIESCDIFLTSGNQIDRLTYSEENIPAPCWTYNLTGDSTVWGPSVTNELVLHSFTLSSGPCQVKIVIPNGISTQSTFGEY
jgi:hypothetical protein